MTNIATPLTDYEQLLVEKAREYDPNAMTWWAERHGYPYCDVYCVACGASIVGWPYGEERPESVQDRVAEHFDRHARGLEGSGADLDQEPSAIEARLLELARKHHPGADNWWREQPWRGCSSLRCLVCGAVIFVWPAGRRRPRTAEYYLFHHYAQHAVEVTAQ